MAKGVYKYDNSTASRIVTMRSEGYTIGEVANSLGVSRNTISRWIKKNDLFALIEIATLEVAQGVIEKGLAALSVGAKATETIEEYTTSHDTGLLDDDGEPIITIKKITKKTKHLPPNEKALEIYARKYAKAFAVRDVEQLEGKTSILVLGVNTSNMTQRDLQKHRVSSGNPLDVIVEASCSEVVDSGVLGDNGSSSLLPPSRDS